MCESARGSEIAKITSCVNLVSHATRSIAMIFTHPEKPMYLCNAAKLRQRLIERISIGIKKVGNIAGEK